MCTHELPDTYPFVVQEAYIKEFIVKWKQPAMELFDSVYEILKADVAQLVKRHFAHMGKGSAERSILYVICIWKRD